VLSIGAKIILMHPVCTLFQNIHYYSVAYLGYLLHLRRPKE